METREKILIGLVGAAAVYALVDFVVLPNLKTGPLDDTASLAETQQFVEQTRAETQQFRNAPVASRILEKAEKEWDRDPFLSKKLPTQLMAEEQARIQAEEEREQERLARIEEIRRKAEERRQAGEELLAAFRYTGRVTVEGRWYCLLNGVEYTVGETIEGDTHRVAEIHPEHVVLEPAEEGYDTLQVPILE
jgi:hypothetical protein